jgi:hypothetical protein
VKGVRLSDAVTMWNDAFLSVNCPLVSAGVTCLAGVSCSSSESFSDYALYKEFSGIAAGMKYACTDSVRSVFQTNDACASTLTMSDLGAVCGSTDLYWTTTDPSSICGSLNAYLQCAYNRIKSRCNKDVAREEITIIAKMIQPLLKSFQSKSCTVDTSYVSGAKAVYANLIVILSAVMLTLISLRRNHL